MMVIPIAAKIRVAFSAISMHMQSKIAARGIRLPT